MYRLSLISFLFISFVNSNELTFNEVIEKDDKSVEISFLLEKVSLVKSYSLNTPSRLVLDIYDTKLKEDINISYNYPIKKIRSISEGDTSRIVIDLYENVFWEKPTQVQTKNGVMLTLVTKRIKNLENSIRDIVIAIDAGHGGKYPGAVGPNNILEKDVTLLIAKELERTLRDTSGYYPVMIRSNDETIDLNSRYQEARKKGADAFISIHADGFRLESVKGASVFIWSDEASSTVARNLSEKQRKRIQADIKNLKDDDFNEDRARNNYPEMYKNKIDQSQILGTKILEQLKRDPYTKIHKQNVEYADFRVLKSVDIPSVLVESGFITNPEDAARLKGKAGRRMIARSIFLGIHNYFKQEPISNTTIEMNPDMVLYEIQKGDVLSEISIRFGVTVDSIIKLNNLNGQPIFPGQILKINI
ncbi:MAG: N-acetylmuramoyl-L-alanine amidase [Gammaproteobacteria bacterium]|tara:strand:+ start:591 stop:1844 length:1254 start_codon:yes stop_codon:yes gene_type:complete